jgi:hypothetical protein
MVEKYLKYAYDVDRQVMKVIEVVSPGRVSIEKMYAQWVETPSMGEETANKIRMVMGMNEIRVPAPSALSWILT